MRSSRALMHVWPVLVLTGFGCLLLSDAGKPLNRTFWEESLGPRTPVTAAELVSESVANYYRDMPLQPRQRIVRCLSMLNAAPPRRKVDLRIIFSITEDRRNSTELDFILDNWRYYANLHGYEVVLNIIKPGEYEEQAHPIFTKRWASLLDRHWEEASWLLHMDTDSLAVNPLRSLESFLRMDEHLLFHMRENAEITAAAVLMRTSAFSRCFVQTWADVGQMRNPNYDNGDLNHLLLEYFLPTYSETCNRWMSPNYNTFMRCFQQILPLWDEVHKVFPVRFLYPLAGFWRSTTPLNHYQYNRTYVCFQSDVVAHGWKVIGKAWWGTRTPEQVASGRSKCKVIDFDEQVKVAGDCCMWHHPGCTEKATGINRCRILPHCMRHVRMWGMALRTCHDPTAIRDVERGHWWK